jgi:two-component system phosphate regulon response regulator PhoB
VATSILIVEDEPAIREMVRFALERAGFSCREAHDGERALVSIADQRPDLVLIDWMLPGISGIDLARRLKREETTKETPVIMLTARGEEEDRIRGLEVGADDYVTKPFSPRELVARIKAVMRRYQTQNGDVPIEIDKLRLDPSSHRVTISGSAVDMGPTEFRLLHFFMTHPERVYSRGQLLDRVWGSNVYVEERTVDVHIRRLRKALDAHGHDRYIQTVRGSGYRFSSKE